MLTLFTNAIILSLKSGVLKGGYHMKCPNCNTSYDHDPDRLYCPECGHPLGNADYKALPGRRHKEKKPGHIIIIALSVCFVLIMAAFAGYYAYIQVIKTQCRQATDQIFEMARKLDFSEVDPEYLPEEIRENPNIRDYIKSRLQEIPGYEQVEEISSEFLGDILDVDKLCDDITESASYEIIDVEADYHTCKVTVRTENTDFAQVADSIYQNLYSQLTDDKSIWESIGSFFSSLISGEDDDENSGLSEQIEEIYKEAKADADKVTATGTITFAFKGGPWTITDMDEELFLAFYGISNLVDQ